MRRLLHAFFPPRCPLCDAFVDEAPAPCAACASQLQRLDGALVAPRLKKRWFTTAHSCFVYQGSLAEAIHQLKYNRRFDLLPFFTREFVTRIDSKRGYDVIIPVPLHMKRLRERGFNQSAMLAQRLAKETKILVDLHTLLRVRHDAPQVGQEAAIRRDGVRNAFSVAPRRAHRLKEKRLLLIDDVITTGATINECARALMKANAERVDVLTIARTL